MCTHIYSGAVPLSPTDKGIAALSRIVRKTEELLLIRLKHLTGEGLKKLMSRSLRYLSLQESGNVTDPGLVALIRSCPNIEKLCLPGLHKVSDAVFLCIAEVLGSKLVSFVCNLQHLLCGLHILGGVGCYWTESVDIIQYQSTGHTLYQPQNVIDHS